MTRMHEPVYSQSVELDLASVEPSIAGPKRPQDRIPLAMASHAVGFAACQWSSGCRAGGRAR